ncbi:MAG TPA: hypothetical protein VLS88_17020 [Polyangiales bacterium]|nr:hypothetical protein [Polyangiales bacterium]
MQMLKQIDARFYEEVMDRQARVWAELRQMLSSTLEWASNPGWAVEGTTFSVEEIMVDLEYGQE